MGIERPEMCQQDFGAHINSYIESLKAEKERLQAKLEELKKQLAEYIGEYD